MKEREITTFYPENKQKWREWLQENHDKQQAVWLIIYNRNSGKPSLSWAEAVEEALCFGWIDSKVKPVDENKRMQFFSRRKSKGTWSKINKENILRLTAEGLMSPEGLRVIETAKLNGSWTILDEVEELIIPKDLEKAFKGKRGSKDFFLSLSRSAKKAMLQWIALAKQPDTRQRRIEEIAANTHKKKKPPQFST